MQLIPVLDLKTGQAVHAVRGQREQYSSVQGVLGSGADPLALATAYRDRLGCQSCYIADLDAITGHNSPHNGILRTLASLGLTLWVDAGVSSPAQAWTLTRLGVTQIIIGSETLRTPEQLLALAAEFPPDRLVLSVDLQSGVLRAPAGLDTPHHLVALAAELGLGRVILLDLARVGATAGPPLDLLTALQPHFPHLAFYAGGGVRHRADLEALAQAGAAGALIATAFHQGILTAAEVQAMEKSR